jgi:hypothetical protein
MTSIYMSIGSDPATLENVSEMMHIGANDLISPQERTPYWLCQNMKNQLGPDACSKTRSPLLFATATAAEAQLRVHHRTPYVYSLRSKIRAVCVLS